MRGHSPWSYIAETLRERRRGNPVPVLPAARVENCTMLLAMNVLPGLNAYAAGQRGEAGRAKRTLWGMQPVMTVASWLGCAAAHCRQESEKAPPWGGAVPSG